MTQDIDIDVGNDQLSKDMDFFLESLEASDFIFDADAIRVAVAERGPDFLRVSVRQISFNAIKW